MKPVFHLAYASMASGYISPKIVDGILKKARAANAALGISGLLLFRLGHFIQLLEGDEEKVRTQHLNTILGNPLLLKDDMKKEVVQLFAAVNKSAVS